jgi:ABC-type phosphate transport system substrate-binding protein
MGTRLNWPIGYVEFVYAIQHQLGFGTVQNSSGQFVRASLDSLAEAAKTAASDATFNSVASITNSPGKAAYSIASFTWFADFRANLRYRKKSKRCVKSSGGCWGVLPCHARL